MQLRQRRHLSKEARRENLAGWLFALPWILGFLCFSLVPICYSFYYSLTDYDLLQEPWFLGFQNYIDMFTRDKLFWKSLGNTFYYVLISVPLSMIIGLAIALLLNHDVKGIALFRTLYYLPSVVPTMANCLLWIWIFNPNYGLLFYLFKAVGLQSPNWLSDPGMAKFSLILMSLWGAGSGMIIYLAGLKNIPPIYYEAAELDGAKAHQRFIHITLPMLSPTLFFQLIMGMIGAFQVFTQAFVMTNGGPNNATMFYVYYLYNNAFRFWKMGYASALAWVLFIIIMIFTGINFLVSKFWVNYDQV